MFDVIRGVDLKQVEYFGLNLLVEKDVVALATDPSGHLKSFVQIPTYQDFRGSDMWLGAMGKTLGRIEFTGDCAESLVLYDDKFHLRHVGIRMTQPAEIETLTVGYFGHLLEVPKKVTCIATDGEGSIYGFISEPEFMPNIARVPTWFPKSDFFTLTIKAKFYGDCSKSLIQL